MQRTRDAQRIIRFLSEAGELKRVRRSGWWSAGVNLPESVADHSFRCAMIAYLLAKLESADPYKTMVMALFNDMHETRIGDLHKIAQHYLGSRKAKKAATREQLHLLPALLRKELSLFLEEYDRQRSKEALIAKDADILECLLQAREYYDFGFQRAKKFIDSGQRSLKTKAAKAFLQHIKPRGRKDR